MQVVRALVGNKVPRLAGYFERGPCCAVGYGAYGRPVAGGVVEVALERVKAEHDIGDVALSVRTGDAEDGGTKVHDAYAYGAFAAVSV